MATQASPTRRLNWLVAVRLFHPIPSLVTAAAAVGFGLLFKMPLGAPRLWLLGLVMLLAQFSISAANDWADRAQDAAAARARPVPLGMIQPGTALTIAIASAGAAIAGALLLGALAAALVVLGIAVGWTYDLAAKGTPFSPLPFAVAFPLLPFWVGVVAGDFPRQIPVLFIAGIPVALAIHLADAIPDAESDAAAGARTLAVAVGADRARFLAAGALVLGGLVFATSAKGPGWILLGVALAGAILYLRLANKWILIGSAAATALAWFL